MTKVTGTISQMSVTGTITQLSVAGAITQKGVAGTLAEAGYTPDPPVFVSAVVEDADPDLIVITFNEALDETSVPATTDFSTSGITGSPSITDISISTTDVSLTLSGNVVNGDTVLVSYVKPGSNPLQDADGDDVDSFTNETVTNNVSAYSAEYQLVYDEMTNKPTNPDDTRQNTLVESWVADSLWDTKNDRRYVMAIHTNTANEAQLDWIDPANNLPLLNVNGTTHTAYEGFNPNGTTQYLSTQYNADTDGVLYTLNDASFFYYSRTSGGLASVELGCYDNPQLCQLAANFSGSTYLGINSNDTSQIANGVPDGSGFYLGTRTAVNAYALYWNSNTWTDPQVSTALINLDFYLSARNDAGVAGAFSSRQLSGAGFGGSYDNTEKNNERDNFETYMDLYGKGVI